MVVEALQQIDGGCIPPDVGVGQKVAQKLVGEAKAAGSSDNITVMLVFLRPPEQLMVQHCTSGTVKASPPHVAAQIPGNQTLV